MGSEVQLSQPFYSQATVSEQEYKEWAGYIKNSRPR
jgi:hypothetical protein